MQRLDTRKKNEMSALLRQLVLKVDRKLARDEHAVLGLEEKNFLAEELALALELFNTLDGLTRALVVANVLVGGDRAADQGALVALPLDLETRSVDGMVEDDVYEIAVKITTR